MVVHFFELLVGTVLLRPYVFVFLGCYLFIASRELGWRRMMSHMCVAYSLAWVCEKTSITIGIPFGWYRYFPATMERELWVWGVPFMDSLSFVFLTYFSHGTARFILAPLRWGNGTRLAAHDPEGRIANSLPVLVLGPLLMVLLDVIIDPITLKGDRWFLGKLYEYSEQGIYFGVPLANFAGWYVVGFLALFLQSRLGGWAGMSLDHPAARSLPLFGLFSPGLFLVIAGFNLFITWWIGEQLLLVIGFFLLAPVVVTVVLLKAENIADQPGIVVVRRR